MNGPNCECLNLMTELNHLLKTILNYVFCQCSLRFNTYSCEGLQNGHEYRFRVYADNLHGRSEVSAPSEPVTITPQAKDRKQRRRLGDGLPRGEYDGPEINDYDRFRELFGGKLVRCK